MYRRFPEAVPGLGAEDSAGQGTSQTDGQDNSCPIQYCAGSYGLRSLHDANLSVAVRRAIRFAGK